MGKKLDVEKIEQARAMKRASSRTDAVKAQLCEDLEQAEAQIGSFEMQIRHFEKTLGENPDYELVKIYQDEGISGTQAANRPGFQEMLEDAREGKLDVIYTKSITRFGRNAADILSALQMLDALSPPVTVFLNQIMWILLMGKVKSDFTAIIPARCVLMRTRRKSSAIDRKNGLLIRWRSVYRSKAL